MTNEKIKEILLSLENTDTDFTVIQTGKVSKKVNGLYTPATFEILLHDKNFNTENDLIFVAIHEYTHHLINCKQKKLGIEAKNGGKSHTTEFWAKFDDLLEKAIESKIYIKKRPEELSSLIDKAKEIDCEIVNMKRNFGKLVTKIFEKAYEEKIRDFNILRDLNITYKTYDKCWFSNLIDGNFGQDEMELLLKTEDFKTRKNVINSLKKGKTINQVSAAIKKDKNLSQYEKLTKEKARLEKTIQHLEERLEIVSETLSSI